MYFLFVITDYDIRFMFIMSYSLRAGSAWNCQFLPDPARKLSANVYDIYHCCVYSEKLMMDRVRSETCRILSQK